MNRGAADNRATSKRGVFLIGSAHVVNDMYQGVVPAMLPFLAVAYGYSNTAVAGLMLAATAISSIAQPAFGWLADRRSRLWVIWVGMLVAAAGIAVIGIVDSYVLVWIALAVSGLGVAAFHPESASYARAMAGNNASAMGFFALGGNIGFSLGTVVAVLVIVGMGVVGLVPLMIPALIMAVLLMWLLPRFLSRAESEKQGAGSDPRPNDRGSFGRLTAAVFLRSIVFFGLTSFIALFLIDRFDLDTEIGATAVTVLLVSGVAGTIAGGVIADRWSRLAVLRLGLILTVPFLAAALYAPNAPVAFVFVGLTGFALYLPFGVIVMLGQDYLPQNRGIASGVTVGLSVSIGGISSPLIGLVADAFGLGVALTILLVLPVIAYIITIPLKPPSPRITAIS